ncbi:nitronate monooxygenase [Georgenia alba]|uniref:Propionate 3-nitronate monooxygenase n=1 Tax=Georgenia alba TaxID=2233858 RepID=A0ABW2Q585_9MICO
MTSPLEALRRPVLAAPMAGGPSTPALVRAAVEAGGSGFLAAGYLSAERLAEQVTEVGRDAEIFGANLFVPEADEIRPEVRAYRDRLAAAHPALAVPDPHPDDDGWQEKLEVVREAGVPLVSFTFGFPPADAVHTLHRAGATVIATVTTAAEARSALERGADVLCVQGPAAGGHRGTFDQTVEPPAEPLEDLLRSLRGAAPIVAAGGLTTPAAVAAAREAGAAVVQVGTALLVADEAGTDPTHRRELLAGQRETTLTRAFSGRWARGLLNEFMTTHADAPAGYPFLNQLTGPVRAAARRAGDPEAMSMWAGERYRDARPGPAGEILERLVRSHG